MKKVKKMENKSSASPNIEKKHENNTLKEWRNPTGIPWDFLGNPTNPTNPVNPIQFLELNCEKCAFSINFLFTKST